MMAEIDIISKQRFSSQVFWHFTGSHKADDQAFSVLCSILSSGVLKVNQAETNHWIIKKAGKLERKRFRGWGIVCVADIPLKDLMIHVERYGRFAIGFHKKSICKAEFFPAWYVPQASGFLSRGEKIYEEIKKDLERVGNQKLEEKFDTLIQYVSSSIKLFHPGGLSKNASADNIGLNDYYFEREWRVFRDWNFRAEDVAVVLLPQKFITEFDRVRKRKRFKLPETTPLLPFELVDKF